MRLVKNVIIVIASFVVFSANFAGAQTDQLNLQPAGDKTAYEAIENGSVLVAPKKAAGAEQLILSPISNDQRSLKEDNLKNMINFFAVLAGAIAAFLVGWVWYSFLFGKTWQKVAGYTEEELAASKGKGMGGTMVQAFIAVLIMVYVLAYFLNLLSVDSVAGGLGVAFWLWLGFTAAPMFMNKLWGKNKSMTLFMIDSLHYLAALLVASVVLTLWG